MTRPSEERPSPAHDDACEHSRTCIACGKRIPPAAGLCFSCATTDPAVAGWDPNRERDARIARVVLEPTVPEGTAVGEAIMRAYKEIAAGRPGGIPDVGLSALAAIASIASEPQTEGKDG
jgi:hypothetical protein